MEAKARSDSNANAVVLEHGVSILTPSCSSFKLQGVDMMVQQPASLRFWKDEMVVFKDARGPMSPLSPLSVLTASSTNGTSEPPSPNAAFVGSHGPAPAPVTINSNSEAFGLRRGGSVEPDFEIDIEKDVWDPKQEAYKVTSLGRSTVLPTDKKWPFLLRFPIGCFGICLGLGSQTILWKTLSMSRSMHFMHVPEQINLALWCASLLTLLLIFTTYFFKCVFYFEAVRREFCHPVRINFFFAPWIACMFLALGLPPHITTSVHPALWGLFMAPLFLLELKIYGQWLSGGEKRLCKVANPCTHLSLVGNFVGSLLATVVGLKEMAIFFWAVGLAHYLVLFVTLYQRLPTAAPVPKELHPVFFLFIAAPSIASVAWSKIVGHFDLVSRIAYFVGLFLYTSLIVRVNLFRGFRFSLAWWAYTFPMTGSAIATIYYSLEVPHPITEGMALVLSILSSVTVLSLGVFTILHIFWGTLFPNDMAIAITGNNSRQKRRINDHQLENQKPMKKHLSANGQTPYVWNITIA